MKVHDRVLLSRVLDIFEELGVYEGGRLLLTDLSDSWQRTGFREPDLQRALDAGVEWGALRLGAHDGVRTCTLISEDIPPPPEPKPWWRRLWERSKDQAVVQQASRRNRAESSSARERRNSS